MEWILAAKSVTEKLWTFKVDPTKPLTETMRCSASA